MENQRTRRQRSDLLGTTLSESFLYADLQILGCLEHSLRYGLDSNFFLQHVIYYYKERLQKTISISQIEEKLQFFWSYWHPVSKKPSDWKKIYDLGLKGLPRLPEDRKEWVRKEAVVLKNDTEGTPRRLRSTSMAPRTLSSPSKRPSKGVVGSPSSGRARKRREYSEGLFQKKRKTMMSVQAVS